MVVTGIKMAVKLKPDATALLLGESLWSQPLLQSVFVATGFIVAPLGVALNLVRRTA